ncbi:MAG TPA: hypothetical protein VNV41_10075 [Candidatus Acidoferrales bacterium]|nr:hypothetical protein [Candidatus Acidoferrales bacterium]
MPSEVVHEVSSLAWSILALALREVSGQRVEVSVADLGLRKKRASWSHLCAHIEAYRTLRQNLKESGFAPGINPERRLLLEERGKPKNSYDLIWTLNEDKNGAQSVVKEITKSPILGRGDIAVGYLPKNFASIDHCGPAQYARFEQSGGSEEARAVLRRYAHGTVTEFLMHWHEGKLPSQG